MRSEFMPRALSALLGVLLPLTVQAVEPPKFRDVAAEVGLMPALAGINGHGAGWGDLDGDGYPELYVGTFDRVGEKPNVLFKNRRGLLEVTSAPATRITGRANTILFVDLDNDGDLDLYLTNLGGGNTGYMATTSRLFRNDAGQLTDMSAESGACPAAFRGRSAVPFDFDGDGDLDLLLGESIQYGSERRSRLLRNRGGLKFEDVSDAVGLPPEVPGLGAAVSDINNDGWPDFFLSARYGGNRLFVNDRHGRFNEWPQSLKTFDWTYQDGDDTSCGVCTGDVNRDGKIDIVVGHHFDGPWKRPQPVRLFLNRTNSPTDIRFEEVTAAAGLVPLPLKAPHVEVQDVNNDGWFDIVTSIVKFADGQPHPVIFLGTGIKNDIPQFVAPALGVNDFPTTEDQAMKSSGAFFKKMLLDRKITYTAPMPSADFDRDGKLDFVFPNWFPEAPSMLLKNETPGGHWLNVSVRGAGKLNRMGIGCRVRLYAAGKVGQPSAELAQREIGIGFGYASGQEAVAHFGLGDRELCDVKVELPFGLGEVVQTQVRADQRIVIGAGHVPN